MAFWSKLKFPTKDLKTVGGFFYEKLRPKVDTFKRDYETIRQPAKKEVSKYLVGKPFKPVDIGRRLIKDAPQVRRDVGTIGSWFLNKMKERTEDVATIGRALPQVKTPFGAIRKMTYEPEVSRIGQSFKGGVAGTMEGTGRGLEWLGFDKMKPFNDKVQEWKENLEVENQTFVEKLYSGIGSMSLFYAPGLGAATVAKTIATVSPKIAMLVGGGTMTAFEAMTEAGNTWQETKDMGLGEQEADKKAEKVFWANAVLIGITNKLGFFGEHKKGLLKKLLMTSTMEGTQEFGQEVIQNVIMGRQWDLNAYEAGKIGFLIGGLFGFGNINPSNQKQAANKTQKILGLSETQSIKFIGMVQDFQEKATKYVKEIKPGLTIEDVSQSDKYLETMRRPKVDEIKDITPKGYAPSTEIVEKIPLERLKGETADQAMARKVGYQVDNDIVKLYQDPKAQAWKSEFYIGGDKNVITGRKQDVIKETFERLYPEVNIGGIKHWSKTGVTKPTLPKALETMRRPKEVSKILDTKKYDYYYKGEKLYNIKPSKGLNYTGKDFEANYKALPQIGSATFETAPNVKAERLGGFQLKDTGLEIRLKKPTLPKAPKADPFAEKEIQILNPDILKTKSQLTDIYNKAKTLPDAKKPPVVKIKAEEGVKLLTTPDIAGEGFVMKGLPKRYGLLPATRMQRELETARRMRIEKKVTDPLLHRLDKTNTRKGQIRIVRDYFGLTDAEIKSISRKDVGLMSDFEFKNFIDDVRIKADKLGKKKQAMNELIQQTMDKELDVENMRKAMKLPTMKNMTITDIKKLDEAIKPFQKGDEFLSVRKLEVVDRTELKGIKTWREAREKLAKKLGVSVEKIQNIQVSEFDRFRYDTALAERNPFYKMMVEESAGRMLVSEAKYLEIEKEVFTLAKGLKPKGVIGRIIPQQKNIIKFMETPIEERATIKLTETELNLAKFMQKHLLSNRDYLIQMEAMKMGKENYFMHIRRGILEAVKEDGVVKAVKEVFTQYKLEEQGFNILDGKTGKILAYDKFFKFAMHRTGGIKPTENAIKAFLTYQRTFLKKQALDEIVGLIDIYAHSLTPKGATKKGLLLHGDLQAFVKEWLNTKKGRHITLMAKQNGKIDGTLRTIKMFTSLRDLGLNLPVSIASEVGEQVTTYQLLGKGRFALGKIRQNTKQGKVIIEKYRNLIGKNPWRELIEPSKEAGDRLMEGIFILFRDASTRANKTFLLGSLSKEEFKAGIIDPQRLSALRTELGRYRMVQGMKSIVGSTPEGGAYTQYKTWAIPILRTNVKNLEIIGKKITRQSKGSKEWQKSVLELYREVEITAFAMLAFSLIRDEDDNSFIGQIMNKAYRESTTLIQALQPKMFLTAGRTASFVTKLGENITSILLLEKYKTKEGYKGVEGLKRQLTPVVIRQFGKATEEPESDYEKAISEDKEKDTKAKKEFEPTFEKIQDLEKSDTDEMWKIINNLSDNEYEIYKKFLTSAKTKATNKAKEEFYPTFKKIQDLENEGKTKEMWAMINRLTEEEYKIYEKFVKKFD